MAATYTVKQVAKILGYSTNSIYTFLKEKRIKGVRVGKGRFRVTQQELDRLLTLSKNLPTQNTTQQDQTVSLPTSSQETMQSAIAEAALQAGVNPALQLPVVPWFWGFLSIVFGVCMWLPDTFTVLFSSTLLVRFGPYISALFVVLGLLQIITSFFTSHTGIRIFFALLLALTFGSVSVSVQLAAPGAAIVFGIFALLNIITTLLPQSLARFMDAVVLFLLLALPSVLSLIGGNGFFSLPTVRMAWWIGICLIPVVSIIFGKSHKTLIGWTLLVCGSAVLLVSSVVLARSGFWMIALSYLLSGVFGVYAPIAPHLGKKDSRTLMIFHGMFSLMLFGTLAMVLLVGTLFANTISSSRKNAQEKLQNAKIVWDASVMDMTSLVTRLGADQQVNLLLSAGDFSGATEYLRSIAENNRSLGALIIASPSGSIVTAYPVFDSLQPSIPASQTSMTNPFVYTSIEGNTLASAVEIPVTRKKQQLRYTIMGYVSPRRAFSTVISSLRPEFAETLEIVPHDTSFLPLQNGFVRESVNLGSLDGAIQMSLTASIRDSAKTVYLVFLLICLSLLLMSFVSVLLMSNGRVKTPIPNDSA